MDSSNSLKIDVSATSEELDTSLESLSSDALNLTAHHTPQRPSPFTLRSQCGNDRCPMGTGIVFRSRISPSPSKQRIRSRRRRRSDQSHVDDTTFLELSHDHTRLQDHNHQQQHHNHYQQHNHVNYALQHHHHNGIHTLDHHYNNHTQPQAELRASEMVGRTRTPRRKKDANVTATEQRTRVSHSLRAISSNDGPEINMNGGIGGLAESVKNSVLGFLTPTKEKNLPAIVESSESGFEEGNSTGKGERVDVSSPAERFTSASEFFAGIDSRDRLTSDYFSGADTPSKLRASTRRLSNRKPYNQYIAYSSDEELDEWQQQPKSNYTYSESLTYRDRVTPDRKIGSPNMSRRGLRGGDLGYHQSPEFSSTHDMSHETDRSHLNLRTRTVLRSMDALSDTSDGEVEEEVVRTRRPRSSRSQSIDVVPKVNGSTVTRTVTSSSFTTTRTLHRGLDTESDGDGVESTVLLRATPLTARSGTPLGRSATPINRSRSKSTLLLETSKGYTLAKGAIAEDLEEEERPESTVMVWTKNTWQTITRICTIITTSIIMMATRALTTATAADTGVSSTSETSSKYSIFSTMNTSRRKVMTVTTELFESSRNRLRKNPILLWIPLLFILLLLALVAYWWLSQSRAKTGDTTHPTETDGPSFLPLILTSASDLTFWVTSNISHSFTYIQECTLGIVSWLASACYTGLLSVWTLIVGMFSWLGSAVQICLEYILQFLYLILEYLYYLVLAILSLFSSSVSYVTGLFLPFIGTNQSSEDLKTVNTENLSWNSWASSFSPMEWMSEKYASTTDVIQASKSWLWTGWLWLVMSISEGLGVAASFVLWLLSSIWSLVWYLISGFWTSLMYVGISTIGFITSAATTVSSVAVETSSSVISNTKVLVSPFFQSSEPTGKVLKDATVLPQPSADTEQNMHTSGVSVEEVVSKVLNSEELKVLIATATSGSSNKDHLTVEDVSNIVKSVMEKEMGTIKTETTSLWNEIKLQSSTSQETSSYMQTLKQQHEHLLKQLDLLGAGLVKIEGSSEVDRKQLEANQREYKEQLANLRKKIEQLSSELSDLQNDHTSLATEVKSCCKNTSVSLADVEKHVTTLLGDILGLPDLSSNHTPGGNTGARMSWSAKDMGAWLKSYFVAKEELETRLNALMATMQAKNILEGEEKEASMIATQATVAQTSQLVMETILEKLRAEIHLQHTQFSELSKEQVAEQVNLKVDAAAAVLGQQVSEQIQDTLHTTKQQLHESVNAAVKEAVPEFIASAVPKAVASAVTDSVTAAVPDAVERTVAGAVSVAVEGAVNTAVDRAVAAAVSDAVPDAVKAAVSEAVPQAVESAVPKAITKALPNAVNDAVHEAVSAEVQGVVAVAVPEVVASVLPAAISTAVNETVSSVVADAVMELRTNMAGEQYAKVRGTGEERVAFLAGASSGASSVSTSSEDATFSATVNISKNNSANFSFIPAGMPFAAGLNESAVIQIVKDALLKYDADKTGMVDHALESAGGNVISTRCTESYQVHQAQVRILGIPVYHYSTNNPRSIIQPDRMPGQCWAFKGSQGYIVIQLAGLVKPTAFSLEHIPKSLSPNGEIESAPREFEVWGLFTENDEGVHLGSYEYDQNGEPLQSFIVKKENNEYFPLIELKINSNHGNMHYTCLYRFRVHGVRHL
nr:uncharacterized protein LOC123763584 isoform X2 [Procambarus clarkii]